jgi:multisubunit Na+/H+ antiporter MnhE subunit
MKSILFLLLTLAANFLLYLMLTGLSDKTELVAAAVTAVSVTIVLRRARSSSPSSFLPAIRWFGPTWLLPGVVFQESWLLLRALVRQLIKPEASVGGFVEYPLKEPRNPEEDFARLAVATYFVSLTPNDYVVTLNREKNCAVVRILWGRELSSADRAFLELT